MAGDMLTVILVKAQAHLLNAMIEGISGLEEKGAADESLYDMVKELRQVLCKKVDNQLLQNASSIDNKIEL